MKISIRWLNEYLDPANVTAEGAEQVLTHAGFPIETVNQLPNGDVMLDVEVTSNRGDCLSHFGLAREIAAGTGRRLRLPAGLGAPGGAGNGAPNGTSGSGAGAGAGSGTGPGSVAQACRVENLVPQACRLFTARLIRGVKVRPSPAWMVEALAAVGQCSINNVVDATNYVLFEFGQPTHVFDVATLRGQREGHAHLIVRYAKDGEKLTLLDGRTVALRPGELVVADPVGAVSLAGIMGGAPTQVTGETTDVLLEAATWDPQTIRRAARRLGLRTDASFRFERTVDPRTIDPAARRVADLILEHAGGRMLPGVVQAGPPPDPPTVVSLRPARVRAVLGVEAPTAEIVRTLRAHEVRIADDSIPDEQAGSPQDALRCTIPPHRPDLTREIDLIEEVARTQVLARIPILDTVPVRAAAPQADERAMRELATVLTGLGFYETITVSFVPTRQAQPFLPAGMSTIEVCDERRKADPTLRPSLLTSLLACRRANQDGSVHVQGGVRLFETASVFAQVPAPGGKPARHVERTMLALLADVAAPPGTAGAKPFDLKQQAVRLIRAVIEAAARALGGPACPIEFVPGPAPVAGFEGSAAAEVRLAGQLIGTLGLVSAEVQHAYDLGTPVVAAEVELAPLLALFPPKVTVHALPEFPGIERDLSLVVDEAVPWAQIASMVAAARLDRLEPPPAGLEFVGTYRGQQVGPGKKSVTLRLSFRDPARTLRREEVDGQVQALVALAKARLGAELRM